MPLDESFKPAIGFALAWLLKGDELEVVGARLKADRRYRHFADAEINEILALANRNVEATFRLQEGAAHKSIRNICRGQRDMQGTIGVRFRTKFREASGEITYRNMTMNVSASHTKGDMGRIFDELVQARASSSSGHDSVPPEYLGYTIESVVCQGFDAPTFESE